MHGFSLISVIVPVYKVEKYIAECIESILQQTYSNIELLLVDDGSPDNSGAICDDYAIKDSRVRVIHQQNQGVSRARNAALGLAKGDWVIFVDSDDTINKDYIECLVKANPNLDKSILAVSGATRIERETKICRWERKFKNREYTLSSLSEIEYQDVDSILLFGTILGKLYNTEIIRSNGLLFDEQLSLNEDHLFFFEYIKHITVLASNNNVGYNYFTDGSASLSTSHHLYYKRVNAYKKMRQSYGELLDIIDVQPLTFKRTTSMVCSIYLDSIKSCYFLHEDKESCLNVLRNIDRKEICKWYSPTSKQGKMLKSIILLPNCILHLILKIII